MTSRRRSRRLLPLLAAVSLASTWAASAEASPEYPKALREALDAPCAPTCTVCHLTQNGGEGTALKPFAEEMIQGGLEGEDEGSISKAIEVLKLSEPDSDDDGIDDLGELAQGRDPNVAGAGDLCGPAYGCGARIEPDGRLDGWALGFALGVAGLLAARLRRRR